MMKDPTEFRQRFSAWKAGNKVYDAGKPITDDEYYSTMERVAKENWLKWGDSSEDAALTRILNANDYDYRGYYDKYPESLANADTHWTDEFKTVYHPTFSEESRYSGKKSKFNPEGLKGGSWGENDKFYPQNWLMFGTKHSNLKRPLPKYDDGTGDKTYLPEYEYEATVTPQGTSLEKHKRITNEEDWQKYWGNVGAGYVNKALEEAAPYVLNGMSMLIGNPIGAFGGLVGSIVGEELGANFGSSGRTIGGLIGGVVSDPTSLSHLANVKRGLRLLGKTTYNAALPTLGRITKPYTDYFAAEALSNSIDNAAAVTTFPKVLPNYEQLTNVIDRELPIRSNMDLLRKADFDLPQIDRSYMNSVYNNRFSQGAQHYAAVDPTDASYIIKYDKAGKDLDELKNYIGSLKILNQYDDVVVPLEFIGQVPTGIKDWAGKDLFRGFYRQKRIYPIDELNVMSAYYNNRQKFKKLESLGKKSHKALFDTHETKGPDIVIPEGRIGDFTFEHNIGVDQNGKPKIFDPMLFIDVPQKYRDAPSSALEFDYIKDYNDFIKLSALHDAINLFDKGKSIKPVKRK